MRPCFLCARTVSEPHLFDPWNLWFERKQLPRFVGIVNSQRKATEPLEATRLPGKQVPAFHHICRGAHADRGGLAMANAPDQERADFAQRMQLSVAYTRALSGRMNGIDFQ